MSSAAGPTRLARASVVRGGFSVSSTSETGLVYRGRSTCVTSSCGCSTSSNSSSLSPLRSSSDIDGYRRESGGVWEGCWELCFVNVRVLPVAVGELVRTYMRDAVPSAHTQRSLIDLALFSFFFKDTRPPVQSRMGWQCQAAAGWRTSRAGAGSRRRPPWSARSGRAARRCLSARGRSLDLGERELISVGGGPEQRKVNSTQASRRLGARPPRVPLALRAPRARAPL